MKTKMLLFITIAMLAPATAGFAGDGSDPPPKAVTAGTPPAEFAPMSQFDRFRRYLNGLVSQESILRATGSAGIHQAEGTPKEWGGGAEAYGLRVGDAFAQRVIRGTLSYGISAALHEDNRYFVSQQTGFFRRVKYAVKSTFTARHDNGEQYFSFSHIGGAAGTAFISRAWQPRGNNSAGDAASSFGAAIGSDVGFNVFREFWPDIKRHFRKE